MKKLLLILCVPLMVFGQTTFTPEQFGEHHFPYFRAGSYQYLIADDVNIRLGPSTKTSIVASLPIGSRVKIIEELTYRYIYNNISFPWYKVSFILDNREKIGYVVGGFIAEEFFFPNEEIVKIDNDGLYQDTGLVFLLGISEYYTGYQPNYQVRVAYQNKEIDKLEFFASEEGDQLYFDVTRNEDIGNGIYIIKSRFVVGACYTQNNEVTVFFDDDKLYHIKTFSNEDEKYLGFKNGRIQLLKGYWYDDPNLPDSGYGDGNSYKEIVLEEYIWDGSRLQKIY